MHQLDRLHIAGFKSIRDQEVELRRLNVLIGANGSGKSNFIGVFRLLHEIVDENLQSYVGRAGGASRLLHFGSKVTDEISLLLQFELNQYQCRLVPTADERLLFDEERARFQRPGFPKPFEVFLGSGHLETQLHEESRRLARPTIADHVIGAIRSWTVYHFHDTSTEARVKQLGDLADNSGLRPDARNLAAFLYRLEKTAPAAFRAIGETVRMVAPFFDRFELRPNPLNPDTIRLEWRERGSDAYFDAHTLSDGTLRFLCLATLLLQPELPTTVLIDEPELGLHPYAINLLAGLLQSAAERTQVVVSTQSVTLVNQLAPEDVIVVDRQGRESVFRRPSAEEIASWLDEYALGELWEKNVLGGETRDVKAAHVLVEGQTEDTFVRSVLRPHLWQHGMDLNPVLATTKRAKSGEKFKGGVTDYGKVRRDLRLLLADSSAVVVTTMVDFYGLPADFPGMATLPRSSGCYERARHLEVALREEVGHSRLFPYLSLHEFEALLFVSPDEVEATFPGSRKLLETACRAVSSPEEINDGDETHPAARLMRLAPTYRKPLHGPTIAQRIGLTVLRARCPHFDRWVTGLERLGQTGS